MPRPADIRAILFDKDGTLLDFNRTWFPVIYSMARLASGGDDARARELVEAGGYDWALERFRGGSVVAAGTVEDIVDLWHPALPPADRRHRVATYDNFTIAEGAAKAVTIAGTEATLRLLIERGYVLGIATNDSEAGARANVAALGLADCFAEIIGYDSVQRPKPFADQLLLFAERTGLAPAQIAMVGDNTHDLEMAHAAGAGLAIGVLSGNSQRDELAPLSDAVLDSIADLPRFFAERI